MNIPLQWGVLILEEAVCLWGGRYVGNLYLPNFAINLKKVYFFKIRKDRKYISCKYFLNVPILMVERVNFRGIT